MKKGDFHPLIIYSRKNALFFAVSFVKHSCKDQNYKNDYYNTPYPFVEITIS